MLTDKGLIDYEGLVADAMRDAMRNVVRQVLIHVAKVGELPGEHHFYISFDTNAPGVVVSKRLKERYPKEMTVVLQHRFWDLLVHADRFEVKLAFNSIPERLVIPFDAIKVFVDPSVRFGHQFEEPEAVEGGEAQAARSTAEPAAAPARKRGPRRRPVEVGSVGEPAVPTVPDVVEAPTAAAPVAPAAEQTGDTDGAKVVSLDKFRKK